MKKKTSKKDWFLTRLLGDNTAEILIYDEIGMWGTSAQDFIAHTEELKSDGVQHLSVRLNTPGGDFFDGVAIYNGLRNLGITIETFVDALAASAGSVIAMAGDTIHIAENAFIMIHEPWTVAVGDSTELRGSADRLDTLRDGVIKTYTGRTGQTVKAIIKMLKAETWLGSDEAIELGFADEVFNVATNEDKQMVSLSHDLSRFKHVPKPLIKSGENDILGDKKALELALREAGASRKEAMVIVAAGTRALREAGEPEPESIDDILDSMDTLINIFKI